MSGDNDVPDMTTLGRTAVTCIGGCAAVIMGAAACNGKGENSIKKDNDFIIGS